MVSYRFLARVFLPIAVLLAILVAGFAVRGRPATAVVGYGEATGELTWLLPGEGTRRWRIELQPEPGCEILAGQLAEPGCLLHYRPQDPGVTLYGPLPGDRAAGGEPVPLMYRHLPSRPRSIALVRDHGLWTVLCDGMTAFSLLLPTAVAPAAGFSVKTAGRQGRYSYVLRDERSGNRAPADEAEQRLADALAGGKATQRGRQARTLAQATLASLPLHDDRRYQLRAWLAWDRVKALADAEPIDVEGGDLVQALEELRLCDRPPSQTLLADLAGMFLGRALCPPTGPIPAHEWLGRRRRWLALALVCAARAEGEDHAGDRQLPKVLEQELLLADHLVRRTCGRDLAPLPVEAPDWMRVRWRLAAGIPLADSEVRQPLPPFPELWPYQSPLRPQLQAFLQELGVEGQVASVQACARVRAALTARRPEEALLAVKQVSGENQALLLALLAFDPDLRLVADARRGLTDPADSGSLAGRHLLAYALAALLEKRSRPVRSPPPEDAEPKPSEPPPLSEGLQAWSELLAGTPRSTMLVFGNRAGTLPPAQVLAAALAMQEVAGLAADWTLVDQLPSLCLPLELMKPRN